MSFEVFDRQKHRNVHRKPTQGPYVKVLANGTHFYLNTEAVRLLGRPLHVAFLFDKERGLAAIKQADPEDPNTYTLSNGKQIAARAFIKHYEIEKDRICEAHMENGMLVFAVGYCRHL